MNDFSEYWRKLIHIGTGALALLLRYLTWWQAALCALALIFNNLFILPRIGGRKLWRAADHARGYPVGILSYPVSVLVLILLFHDRLYLAAAMWGLMAIGDGMASLVGTAFGDTRLPWNPHKSWAGSLALVLSGTAGGYALARWAGTDQVGIDWRSTGIAIAAVAIFSTIVESFDCPLDDNITIPVGGGLLLYLVLLISPVRVEAFVAGDFWRNLPWAVGVNLVFAALAFIARTVDSSGFAGSFLVGCLTYLFGGWPSFLMLVTFFVLGSGATKLGYRRKANAGLAQEKGGRRSMKHVLANGGIVPLFAVLSELTDHPALFLIGIAGAMATAASDTVGSEIGQLIGRRTLLITTLRPVPRGTVGAISLEGTLAGVLASLIVAAVGYAAGLYAAPVIWIVAAAALVGTLFESFIGATLERCGHLNNELTNFLNTAAGGAAAIGLSSLHIC